MSASAIRSVNGVGVTVMIPLGLLDRPLSL
jgi:hypothetical protein